MLDIKTYCPASLSFIFKVCPNKNLVKMGSIGIGCTVNKEVIVKVKPISETKIFFNNISTNFPTVQYAYLQLTKKPMIIDIKSPLPLGCGFGISAASTLASVFTINKQFCLEKSEEELIKIAHVSEIVNHTGLGSVGTQTTGGFLLKNSPGLPVDALRLPFEGKTVYAIIIDKLETPKILKDKKTLEYVNQAADLALKKIKEPRSISLEQILDISFEFAKNSTILKNGEILSLIKKIKLKGGHATMAMLGKVILSDIKPSLNSSSYRIEELRITNNIVWLS